jgi:hypothetical protein
MSSLRNSMTRPVVINDYDDGSSKAASDLANILLSKPV